MASVPDTDPNAHWERLQDLFSRAIELPANERESFVRRECQDDAAMAEEVLSLIACDLGTATGPLTNAMGTAIDLTTRDRRSAMVGKKVGAYRITDVLGFGGTGSVYLGERADDRYSAKVAIKIVDSAAVHPELSMRFRAERQILANLNHPNIARLIDAGETEDGRPYLVMEYVEGKTIDVFCDQAKLSIADRLSLFLQVCAAVQYAHQNLVVHRDLKPANVLVTPDGTPKLLDFGIAKLLDSGNAAAALALTRMNDRLLTPEYAAPEQIRGEPVTTASDVYALGTVLYELLTGQRPFVVPSSTSQLELERLICVSDPLRPSAAVMRAAQTSPPAGQRSMQDLAASRGLTAERLARQLTGDLDAICMRALRKEPQARYSSVEQLADDVRRFLAREPVIARQGNWFYNSQRFIRRHAVGVSAAATFVIFVIAFAVVMSIQAQRIAAERDRATQESARAETVSTFMLDVFAAADPFVSQGREITARELLDQAARRINDDLAQQPEVRARLLETMGVAYYRQGLFSKAAQYLEEAVRLRRSFGDTNPASLATATINLGMAQRDEGKFAAAEGSFRAAGALVERVRQGKPHLEGKLLAEWGLLLLMRGERDRAERYLARSAALMREGKAQPSDLAHVLLELTAVYKWKGDYRAAEATVREAVAINHAALPPLHPRRVQGDFQIAELLADLNRNEEAGKLLIEVLDARRKLYGATSGEVADALDALARVRERQGNFAEAEKLSREALEVHERTVGENHFVAGYQRTALAGVLLKRRNLAAAEQQARKALEIFSQTLPADHQYVASAEQVLGEVLIARGRLEEAEAVLRAAQDRWIRAQATPWRIGRTTSSLGEAVLAQGRFAEAEELLLRGYRLVMNDATATQEARDKARERLARCYRETGQLDKLQALTRTTR